MIQIYPIGGYTMIIKKMIFNNKLYLDIKIFLR